jgi:hypothetical protein
MPYLAGFLTGVLLTILVVFLADNLAVATTPAGTEPRKIVNWDVAAQKLHRFTALAAVGDTSSPFMSRASSPRHQCCSSAISARALSTIWNWSGLAIGNLTGDVERGTSK